MENKNNFFEMKKINQCFERLTYKAKNYYRYKWKQGITKEHVLQKQEALIKIAENLDIIDLTIIYYLRNIDGIERMSILQSLRKSYQAECEVKNKIKGTKKYQDILDIEKI